ncbi:protein NRT1/ PTR FAMILY 4.6-like isoform X1 [Carex littledalei]|uniref:Protein NRT1/ PTR FAMILY 4.6-like isoform X1 n=1 Tax=Carex littledalei TaxID=544730 RepID=A0A833R0Q4_9POAL|nr:protein NRT1/ PTR FAMILY 4.6-like isoform X1 [Carex littledalei]
MEGIVNWRGNPVDPRKHGGVRATLFLYTLVVVRSSINAANTNLVGFFRSTHNMTIDRSVILSTNFGGATWMLSILGAFVTDSYMKRFNAILLFGPFEILGFGLLALQVHIPSLHLPPCNLNQNLQADCESLHGWRTSLLYLGLFMVAIGEGFMRAATPGFGGDQFNSDDPSESKLKIRFFDFAAMATCFGAFLGLVLVVWIQIFKGWDLGLGMCALFIVAGLLIAAVGFPIYCNKKPSGSPLTSIVQVFVVALKNRKVHVSPENLEDPQINADATDDITSLEVLPRTKDLRFLDKASIYTGDTNAWSYCSISQVEEAKIFVKMLPILISSIFCYLPFSFFFTLTAPAASTMNTKLMGVKIAPASLYAFAVVLQFIVLVMNNRIIIPAMQKYTSSRYYYTTSHLVCAGIGFVFAMLGTGVAALVERKRRLAEDPKDLSFLWSLPQFICVGLMEVLSFVGLMEFFSNQLPVQLKALSSSMVFFIVGMSIWLDGALVAIVGRVTRLGDMESGWLDGMEFDSTRLDLFYALLTALQLLSFFSFVFCARRY